MGLAQHVVTAMPVFLEPEEKREIEQLNRDTPALWVWDQGKPQEPEETIATALAERTGTAAGDLRTRLDAVLIAGGLRVAWTAGWMLPTLACQRAITSVRWARPLKRLTRVGSCSNLWRQREHVQHDSKTPACGHSASFGV